MIVLHAVLMENMCKGSCSPFMHMSALEKSRMRWIKPLHQDYFWEFSSESSKFHIFENLNDYMVVFCFLQINMYANEEKEGKYNYFFFLSWWWSQKSYCVACLLLHFFCLCFPFLGVIHIVETLKVLIPLKNSAAFWKEKNSIWAKFWPCIKNHC